MSGASATAMSERTIGRHPIGLYVLFFTEMWERFSYYGMRALLVYYMTKQLLFAQEKSSQIYGIYTGLVYLTPILGGMLADKYWGQRKTVVFGGILMAIGQLLLGFESLFYPGLFFLILGNGAFKPNISTQVGSLYKAGDKRRDSAFGIFYMGINLGAFLSPLVCGTLGELYGWRYGFWTAGMGMLVGLVVYGFGQKYLAPDNVMKNRDVEKSKEKLSAAEKASSKLSPTEKNRVLALLSLCFFNIIFWATYEQQGNTMALWADSNTNRFIFGFEIPASWFQSLNPMMIFIITPLITRFWEYQSKKGREPASVTKMGMGCLLLGASYLIMIPATFQYSSAGAASLWWVVACTLFLTIGELYLSPVGLSLVTKVAPVHMVSMIMGTWFLSSFAGNYLCGFIGTFWTKMEKHHFFLMLSLLSMTAGTCILLLQKPLKKAISKTDSGEAVDF